ncbi:unnamed protein product [Onchocerca flexuosa]|uniref:Uncharacterized protein n=1 Tax=Onchocerca flexuosa TaxID=387005 RepID=A0A183HSM1_9BILA|nr:unnamed protein product [Onchocerca flexuosa]
MFSSVRDGFYQELRRHRRQSPSYLKISPELSTSTEYLIGFPANVSFENDCYNNYDQTIISNNRLSIKHSLSAMNGEKRKFSDSQAR